MSTQGSSGRRRRPPRWIGAVLAALALVAACVAGGVAATTLFPSTVETINYRAQLRLSVNPEDVSRLHTPTVFGDINLDFDGPVMAPGVLAGVQVKPNITDLLAQPKVSIKALQPGPLELTNAARDAGIAMGSRFAAGSLFVAVLAVGGYAVWRRRRPSGRFLGVAGACWVLACGLTGVSIWQTYQPDRLDAFRTTGILGAVQRNADLLDGVETRAQQTTPYLKNLLALSAALQDKYAPQSLNEPVAARILLVSDIHGAQQYPLMKAIVEEEQVDAVVDAGDLLNFGSVTEGETVGLFKGIESLGVPYVFVRGNHDANTASDEALLERLARVPNVVLLQPDRDTYTELTVGGVRIAGFNDPRWFGDDNRNNAAKQVPAREAFEASFADRPQPDLVVSHEPGAVKDVERADILVHGHMHSDSLEDNVIGVGTFTGGGPFSHFLEGTEGEELTGQPSAFDIAIFGQDCQLTSLTRYQFRNVIEGRPAYDDVTLVNGARVERVAAPATDQQSGEAGEAAEPPRTCSSLSGTSREQVPAAPRAQAQGAG
ncbi:metallophosphoesterase [Knoellia sp. 3-2P3]|uniref:metallophosphoesterase family protein n=1 Tax=unclassified Knoellia TaxID=2618719 RepID=UPI0023DAC170|nr:metallophosphoesterase [Knoellia sp. 3-2P3]MDF2091420.1 metallophosphoesterase [Knoellia sp. 3-2P3]